MKRWLLLIFISTLILSGCSQEKPITTKKNPSPPKYQQIPLKRELNETEKKLMVPPGTFSGKQYDRNKVQKALDQLPANMTAQQYFAEMEKMLREDYRPYVTTFVNFDAEVKVNHPRPNENITLPASKKLHVSILLDASGSMNAEINGKKKIDSAKEAIGEFTSRLPQNAQVSLRVYGHKGSGSQKDKTLSCNRTEEIYRGLGAMDEKFKTALNQISPSGWTPIAKALESVKEDIQPETTDSIVYVVSDGKETCDGDPVKMAKELHEAKVKTVVNIIGFDVDEAGQQALKKIAVAGGGQYTSVDHDQALKEYLRKEYDGLKEEWSQWKEKTKTDASNQKETKKQTVEHAKEQIKQRADWEKEHFKAANEYLKQKRGETYPKNDIHYMILNRFNLVWYYGVQTGNDLWYKAVNSGNKVWYDAVQEGNDKINEAIEKKNP